MSIPTTQEPSWGHAQLRCINQIYETKSDTKHSLTVQHMRNINTVIKKPTQQQGEKLKVKW